MTMTSTPMNNELIAGSDRNHHHREKQSILRNKVILSILITETAERVAYFGFRAILVLYFHNSLQLSESTSIAMFSAVSGLAYFSPLLGALIADSAWGRYLVILRFGTVYSIGLCLITLAAYEASSCSLSVNSDRKECINTDVKGENSHEIITIARLLTGFGLILVCLGTGVSNLVFRPLVLIRLSCWTKLRLNVDPLRHHHQQLNTPISPTKT
mmetsp:Transcript_6103/g.6882  ORF Transcript_6103/g.6882 Transcript_6103/m.6882 type:complete len:214 (-) Transcript_6103:531-1172(-)